MTTRSARRPRRAAEPEFRAPAEDEGFVKDPDEGDDEPRSSRRSVSRPTRRSAPSARRAEADDEPRGRSRGRSSKDDEPEDGPRESIKGGWGTWKQRKAESSDFADDFKVEYGEKYLVMFLDKEPFAAYNEHWIDEMPKGKKKSYVCIGAKAGCPLCAALGEKPSPKAMFNILEFIDTDEGREAVHKTWTVGTGVAGEIEEHAEDPGLEGNYFVVRKSKSGKNGPTTYHINPVKERDLGDDWDLDAMEDDEFEEWMEKRYDSGYVKMPSKKSLQDIADEVLRND
jgi:hypothetical protein